MMDRPASAARRASPSRGFVVVTFAGADRAPSRSARPYLRQSGQYMIDRRPSLVWSRTVAPAGARDLGPVHGLAGHPRPPARRHALSGLARVDALRNSDRWLGCAMH
jgi:hypothetical protein